MLGEWRESQSTPVQEKKDKGKGKEREVDFSDVEELDASEKNPRPYGPYDVVENLMISQSSLISSS